jgi:uncharacterized membrane protein YdbT with pleckstrin-like domain
MGLSARLLGEDEHVVLHLRTHAKALVLPAAGLVLAGGLTGIGAALIPQAYRPWGQAAVAVVGLTLALWWAIVPYLRWWTSTYTVTNHRLITREGILHRTGRDLPLGRVSDVSYDRSLSDRVLGCGTLVIATAADGGRVVLPDVPDVEDVHVTMTELLYGPQTPLRTR